MKTAFIGSYSDFFESCERLMVLLEIARNSGFIKVELNGKRIANKNVRDLLSKNVWKLTDLTYNPEHRFSILMLFDDRVQLYLIKDENREDPLTDPWLAEKLLLHSSCL